MNQTNPSTDPTPSPAPAKPNRSIFRIVVGVVLLAILIGGGIWWAQKEAERREQAKEVMEEMDAERFAHEATVHITASGFVPSKISVAKGTRIYFENKDSAGHSVVADDATRKLEPHFGTQEESTEIHEIPVGGGHAYSFHNAGTFRAHDGHNSTANVEIEVK